jgi:hypothetical protein
VLTIRLIRCFDGWRNERLHALWDGIAEYERAVRVKWFPNPDARLRHAQCFNEMWAAEQSCANRYVVFTEADWLPKLILPVDGWTAKTFLGPSDCMVGCNYVTRDAGTKRLRHYQASAGGWFFCIDKRRAAPILDFEGDPDPGNEIPDQLEEYGCEGLFVDGEDCYPNHYGVEWPWGTHLFWTRHLHDDPARRISGFSMREVQVGHDRAVDEWLERQPDEYKQVLRHRFGPDIFLAASWETRHETAANQS